MSPPLHGEGTTGSSGMTPPGDFGVWGDSSEGDGVVGTAPFGYGVRGEGGVNGTGVYGRGVIGLYGVVDAQLVTTANSYGVQGTNEAGPQEDPGLPPNAGVAGTCFHQTGVYGYTFGTNDPHKPDDPNLAGVVGLSPHSFGVRGQSGSAHDLPPIGGRRGGEGRNFPQCDVQGSSDNGHGVRGDSAHKIGVHGRSITGTAVQATNLMSGQNQIEALLATPNSAGEFMGQVKVTGDLIVSGNKQFRIDHPLDPDNRYLNHFSVESADTKNIYDGTACLDECGEAVVDLPEWFEALNSDFRYQLTPIGAAAPDLHIAEEVINNRFRIGGGAPGLKVSWQVTGLGKDGSARASLNAVEQEKPTEERGRQLAAEPKDVRFS